MRSRPRDRKDEWHRRLASAALLVALAACNDGSVPVQQRVIGGDAERGRAIIAAIRCGTCHTIPGIAGAHGVVGPPLDRFGERQFIAGIAPNHPEILVAWIRDAPSIDPDTGMPGLPLDNDQARDAAYLYQLR